MQNSTIFALFCALALAACGDKQSPSNRRSTIEAPPVTETSPDEPVTTKDEPAEGTDETPGRSTRRRRGSKSSSTAKVDVVSAGEEGGTDPGKLSGTVLFEGTPPERRVIGPIKKTTGCNHDTDTYTETVIVNAGKLQNVFVYISAGLDAWEPTPVPSEPVYLDQLGCVYRPHVVGVRAGQQLLARNSDPIAHNVHVISRQSDKNQTQGAAGPALELMFSKEEVPAKFVCDIHPWMRAYACIVEHPFFAVTGADGSFVIDGLPPGEYTLTAWHEKYLKQKATLTLGSGGEVSVEFTYKP